MSKTNVTSTVTTSGIGEKWLKAVCPFKIVVTVDVIPLRGSYYRNVVTFGPLFLC